MTFNAQRAEALRSAIQGTAYRIKNYPEGDAKTLLTEHLALLQEAELIYLTDAFVGEGEEPPIFPDIKELDEAAGRVSLRKSFDDRVSQAALFKLTDDGSTAVALDYFWQDDMSKCPPAKVQLLGEGGVAVYGQYNGDPFWRAWAPCPKRRSQDAR